MNIKNLLKWYDLNKRDLPWRQTNNPYIIWLSEVILQQTRVDQGLPYFHRITDKYPTIEKLAFAKKDDFFKLWQGLGYYNRAENILTTAKYIHTHLNNIFPNNYESLIQLKGIGPYTAAAISSIAFEEPKPVLDGNVFRVLSRLYAIEEPVNNSSTKQLMTELSNELIKKQKPSIYNQAMMELGALVCKPTNPLCNICPLLDHCLGFQKNIHLQLPNKTPKKKPITRHINYLVFLNKNSLFIQKRTANSIWKNLYEPPNFDSSKKIENAKELIPHLLSELTDKKASSSLIIEESSSFKHQLTHQTIFGTFWIIQNASINSSAKKNLIQVDLEAIYQYPVHRLFDKFLNYYKLHTC